MQMNVIAWAPPPHTVWRHKMMPGYFYMLMMKRKRTGKASLLPRRSCDMDPRWLPSFRPVLLMPIPWSVSQELFRATRPLSSVWRQQTVWKRTVCWLQIRFSLLCVTRCELKLNSRRARGLASLSGEQLLLGVFSTWNYWTLTFFHFNCAHL